ncbi:hypothetical protein P879_06661 [Paragonimus westermani]|uniref:5'-deoxynucleotidase HDDC2 n=1 Tax=Paragonimus westermani TaxID=34504 RepID=A0A8T0D7A7_9TREM|nr:hypothetical protein P879_06661 [Paragonimus westermani]
MAISTVAKNITKVALCTGAIYYSIVEGVWSTSDQSVGPMSKVKQRLLPQAFQFVNDVRPFCFEVISKTRQLLATLCAVLLVEPMNMPRQSVVQFLSVCGRLKRTVRTGWTRHDIERPESVSDHMYRMALMATVLPTMDRQDISIERLIKMTIVHDLAECIVGDITPHCNVSKEEKLDRETEYNAQQTPEARLCKDFDKFEMLLQAFEYEQECGAPKKLEEFFSSTLGKLCFQADHADHTRSRLFLYSDGEGLGGRFEFPSSVFLRWSTCNSGFQMIAYYGAV